MTLESHVGALNKTRIFFHDIYNLYINKHCLSTLTSNMTLWQAKGFVIKLRFGGDYTDE